MEYSTLIDAVLLSGPITLSIFISLLFLSVVIWAVIMGKAIQFSKEQHNDKKLLGYFSTAEDFKSIGIPKNFKQHKGFAFIYRETCRELDVIEENIPDLNFHESGMQTNKSNVEEIVARTLERVKTTEQTRLDNSISILATTSNVALFIGLLGTVVGIINAFSEIGKAGSADLAFVAPAISEALVATALGLFVAIPSSIAFNYFRGKAQLIKEGYDGFALMLLNKIQHYYFFRKNENEGD